LGRRTRVATRVGLAGPLSWIPPPHKPIRRIRPPGGPVLASEFPQANTARDRRQQFDLRPIVGWAAPHLPPGGVLCDAGRAGSFTHEDPRWRKRLPTPGRMRRCGGASVLCAAPPPDPRRRVYLLARRTEDQSHRLGAPL